MEKKKTGKKCLSDQANNPETTNNNKIHEKGRVFFLFSKSGKLYLISKKK